MKKKSVKKSTGKTEKQNRSAFSQLPLLQRITFRYIVISSIILVFLSASKFALTFSQKPYVLGASIFLADRGSNNSGETNSAGSPTNGSGDASGGPVLPRGHSETVGNNEAANVPVPSNIFVDCVGPDGKHFQTNFNACAKLNTAYGRPNFSFTKLPTATTPQVQNSEPDASQQSDLLDQDMTALEHGDTAIDQAENELNNTGTGSGVERDLQTAGTQAEFQPGEMTTNGTLRKADGTGKAIKKEDLLKNLNDVLKDQEIEVGTTAAHGFSIRKGTAQATTDFPLSIDPTTKKLTITTPDGVKPVSIFPDQAVENALHQNIISTVENEITSSGSVQQTTLTQLNNQPVFAINGVANKHFLGFIPVSFAKTAFVSAETGNVVKVDETFFSKLLESLSL